MLQEEYDNTFDGYNPNESMVRSLMDVVLFFIDFIFTAKSARGISK
jgi:hypothetical protein